MGLNWGAHETPRSSLVSLYAMLSLLSFKGVMEVVVWGDSTKGIDTSTVALSILVGVVEILTEESLEAEGGSLMVSGTPGLRGKLGIVMVERREADAEFGMSIVVFSILVGAVMVREERREAVGSLSKVVLRDLAGVSLLLVMTGRVS